MNRAPEHGRFLVWATVLACALTASADPFCTRQNLFDAGEGGYRLYRIPGIVVTPGGAVLAYCEARMAPKKWAGADWAKMDILMRRSTDGGETWSPPHKVVTPPEDTTPNPVSIEKDLADPGAVTVNNFVAIPDSRAGAVHFLYCIEYERAFYMRSDDDGQTFTKPAEITNVFESFRDTYPWRVIAIGPGHGIQLRTGRLLATVWLSRGTQGNGHDPSIVSTIYSDDNGTTWTLGDIVPADEDPLSPSEAIVVELADGRVMINMRNLVYFKETRERFRSISISPDGAHEWCSAYFDRGLCEPVCMANIIRLSRTPEHDKNRIIYSNPDNPTSRERKNVSIRLSYDEGKTWPVKKVLEPGRSGYTDLAVLPDGTILCLYERGSFDKDHLNTAHLCVARFNLEWLTNGDDRFKPTP